MFSEISQFGGHGLIPGGFEDRAVPLTLGVQRISRTRSRGRRPRELDEEQRIAPRRGIRGSGRACPRPESVPVCSWSSRTPAVAHQLPAGPGDTAPSSRALWRLHGS